VSLNFEILKDLVSVEGIAEISAKKKGMTLNVVRFSSR